MIYGMKTIPGHDSKESNQNPRLVDKSQTKGHGATQK